MSEFQNQLNQELKLPDDTLKFEKYKFNIELLKWFIGSVALVAITFIVDNGYKERTAGIQEMQVYDKYVETILKADNIEDRWKLAQYFSTVTPTKRLRERWCAYRDSISNDYKIFKKLKEQKFQLQQKDTALHKVEMSTTDLKLNTIQNQLAPFEKKLIGSSDLNTAMSWEQKGFSFLLAKDVLNAIDAFRNSENSFNQFHQAYEIANYLEIHKTTLQNPESSYWKTTFKKIATDYSWKMPPDIKNKLIENTN
jgi:hypothetical protein